MTHFSDDLYLGAAKSTPTVSNPNNGGLGIGPLGRIYFWNIIPLTKQAQGYAANQTLGAAGNMVLAAGTGITVGTDPGNHTAYSPDVPRTVSITSNGNETATFTVSGYDYLGQPQTEAIAGPNNTTVYGKKAFKSIWQIAVSAATVGTAVSAGTSDIFGIPIAVPDLGYIQDIGWAGVLPRDAGTGVKADATTPATSTTGDVRGTYAPSSASNGTNRLIVAIHTPVAQSGATATFAALFGVTPA